MTITYRHPPGILPSLQSLLYILIVAMFIFTFIVEPSRIPSASMEPTLLVGDSLLVDKQAFSAPGILNPLPHTAIARGDIIVFHFPVDTNRRLIKRVVALPGDRIRLHANRLYINNVLADDPYAVYQPAMPDRFRDDFPSLERTNPSINAHWWIQMRRLLAANGGQLVVPPGHYFVLGDNRNDSEDSRYWGFVPQANIVGRPLLIYFSLRQPQLQDPTLSAPPAQGILTTLAHLSRWDRIGHIIH